MYLPTPPSWPVVEDLLFILDRGEGREKERET